MGGRVPAGVLLGDQGQLLRMGFEEASEVAVTARRAHTGPVDTDREGSL